VIKITLDKGQNHRVIKSGEGGETKSKTIIVRITDELYQALMDRANLAHTSYSALVRFILSEFLLKEQNVQRFSKPLQLQ
jgi:hypothetical protein